MAPLKVKAAGRTPVISGASESFGNRQVSAGHFFNKRYVHFANTIRLPADIHKLIMLMQNDPNIVGK
ncbi:hypothetical protein [Paenibacillus glucanolyticus]|uniref:hypothetical protein n=1 Tax=Paenibacillus glucanolyticus TaxID=59843 RepID=UPI00096EDD72|nr:hypothetical protein [Paenibacillus glucanolyticus]OMF83203.1 hypothetical protein BK142_00715 [Paenibacillus glucanolyticus]